MVRIERKWLGRIYPALDLAAAEAAFFTAVLLRYGELYPIPPFFSGLSYVFYSVLIALIYLPVLWAFGASRERVPSVLTLVKGAFVLSFLANVLPFYFRDYAFSRLVIMGFCLLTFVFGLAWRFVFHLLMETAWGSSLIRERVLLAARAERMAELVRSLEASASGRLEIVSLAVDGDPARLARPELLSRVAGSMESLGETAPGLDIDAVYLDPEGIGPGRWLPVAESLASEGIGVRLLSGLEYDPPLLLGDGTIAPVERLDLLTGPLTGFQALIKRTADIVVSALVLVLCSPLMLVLAAAVRLRSPGPALYSQERVGRQGVAFDVHKFRTMVREAERDTGPVWSSGPDERVIPGIGHFLRRTGLDELPQFWNILLGRMSLVGPRPERPFFFEKYPGLYRGRLAVRPGLTGLAQVTCRETTSVDRKVRYDLYYIRNYSLGLDLEILWLTFVMLVRQEWDYLFGGQGGGKESAREDGD